MRREITIVANDHTFTAEQAAAATTAMRMALKQPPEQFSVPRFVAMISDEIEQLRATGMADREIAALVEDATGSPLSAEDVTQYYAPAALRGEPGRS